ncbi:hypothetical protein BCR34DRAFT_106594 [Clohesyomyces aquaticus]|uniref:Uncharacterized protein n=1 Tax=Clohesyomyces aquaticus TaxID=1231657 RepID=A0A1Y2A1Q6_9PLEO|nr:hypothetical protein BCR34DRAFT_106594 [Clohesyomyces aquaticus]
MTAGRASLPFIAFFAPGGGRCPDAQMLSTRSSWRRAGVVLALCWNPLVNTNAAIAPDIVGLLTDHPCNAKIDLKRPSQAIPQSPRRASSHFSSTFPRLCCVALATPHSISPVSRLVPCRATATAEDLPCAATLAHSRPPNLHPIFLLQQSLRSFYYSPLLCQPCLPGCRGTVKRNDMQ